MEKIIVHGGNKLNGTVKVSGAKNAVLPVIAASILAGRGTSHIYDVPSLADVYTMQEVLRNLNIDVDYKDGTFSEMGIYPAVDPLASTSRALSPEVVGEEQSLYQQELQIQLQCYS